MSIASAPAPTNGIAATAETGSKPVDPEKTANLLLGYWDSGGRRVVLHSLGQLAPVMAAAIAARLAGMLFERNVMEWKDFIDLLELES
jgi:hypothetical protein